MPGAFLNIFDFLDYTYFNFFKFFLVGLSASLRSLNYILWYMYMQILFL